MNCTDVFQRKNYSMSMLNYAFNNDAGSWWWWTNVIGTLIFGIIGLIGNCVCFLVVNRFSHSSHSFVEHLRVLCIFDFFTLFFEVIQAFNDLSTYYFSFNLLNFRSSFLCKFYDYSKYSVILLSCWTIVALTIDRFLLVCHPFAKTWPNLPRRVCNSRCARRIIIILIIVTLLINIPHVIFKEWICRPAGFQYSAAFNQQALSNQSRPMGTQQICTCRVSPNKNPMNIKLFLIWHNYVFHLFAYTLIPAVILIISNTAILRRLNAPRKIVSHQNENLRSKLTVTLTIVSLIFLVLYTPYAIVHTVSYFIIRSYQSQCNIIFLLRLRILKSLSELLNIGALGINFFFYILAVTHYRSSAIKMLRLNNFHVFTKYFTIPHRNFSINHRVRQETTNQNPETTKGSNTYLLKVPLKSHLSNSSLSQTHSSTQL